MASAMLRSYRDGSGRRSVVSSSRPSTSERVLLLLAGAGAPTGGVTLVSVTWTRTEPDLTAPSWRAADTPMPQAPASSKDTRAV